MIHAKRRMRLRAGGALLTAIATTLVACMNPMSSFHSSSATITGRVFNDVTGTGLPNALVVLGSYSATTDSSGSYSITLSSGTTSASGDLAVSDGTGYSFLFQSGASITTSGGTATVDFPLAPTTAGSTTYITVSGAAAYANGTALASGDTVNMIAVNAGGGVSFGNSQLTTSGSYSLSIPPCGSSCFVVVTVTPSSSNTSESTESYYIPNQALDSSTILNLMPPSTGTPVDVSGIAVGSSTPSMQVSASLDVPNYGVIPIAETTATSPTAALSVYDPGNYPVVWTQGYTSSSSPIYAEGAASGPKQLTTTVSLPPITVSPPRTYADLTNATYTSGTLAFTPPLDATGTLLDIESTANSFIGIAWTTGKRVTLPTSIQNIIASYSVSSLTTVALGVNTSTEDPSLLASLAAGNLEPPIQFAYAFSASTSGYRSSFP